MFKVNQDYLKLPGSYLFSTVARKQREYQAAHPEAEIIKLSIGDVTQPLAPAIVEALHGAVDEMAHAETFHGYAPDLGYEFLRSAMAKNDYQAKGCDIKADEIFISDGAKEDCGNIQEIFSKDSKIAVCDPVYPVYVDTNVMAGRTGTYDAAAGTWSNVIYMPCTKETNFAPELPKETPDIIYLCFPNNPTGSTVTKEQLQTWVDYANKTGAVIIYDAAYEAYISEKEVPHSIYECDGARTCAIEIRSFSKNAGFTSGQAWMEINPNFSFINSRNNQELIELYKKLIELRHQEPAISEGSIKFHFKRHPQVLVYERAEFLIIVNLADKKAHLDFSKIANFADGETINYQQVLGSSNSPFQEKMVLLAWEYRVYKK